MERQAHSFFVSGNFQRHDSCPSGDLIDLKSERTGGVMPSVIRVYNAICRLFRTVFLGLHQFLSWILVTNMSIGNLPSGFSTANLAIFSRGRPGVQSRPERAMSNGVLSVRPEQGLAAYPVLTFNHQRSLRTKARAKMAQGTESGDLWSPRHTFRGNRRSLRFREQTRTSLGRMV